MKKNKRITAMPALLLCLLLCLLPCALPAGAEAAAANIPVQLSLAGGTPGNLSTFTFALHPHGEKMPMPPKATLTLFGPGSSAFGPILYTAPDNYTYTLYQTKGSAAGYTYDPQIYTVTVQVTNGLDGLETAVTLKDSGGVKANAAAFVNRYHVNTTIPKTGPSGYGSWVGVAALGLAAALKQRKRR